jgi:hypothetical protein
MKRVLILNSSPIRGVLEQRRVCELEEYDTLPTKAFGSTNAPALKGTPS